MENLQHILVSEKVTAQGLKIYDVLQVLFDFDNDFNGNNGLEQSQYANKINGYESDIEALYDLFYEREKSRSEVELLERMVDLVMASFETSHGFYWDLSLEKTIIDDNIVFSLVAIPTDY